MPTYTRIRMLPTSYLARVARIVAQCSECPEYFVRGTLLMHMLHTAPRLYNWPARCVSTDRSNMLLPQTYRRDPSFRFCVCYE